MSNETTEITDAKATRAELAAKIVMVYVTNNILPAASLPGLIGGVRAALAGLDSTFAPAVAGTDVEKPMPAAIKKSIAHDALISFIDGKPYKMLKRHLGPAWPRSPQLPGALRPPSRLSHDGTELLGASVGARPLDRPRPTWRPGA